MATLKCGGLKELLLLFLIVSTIVIAEAFWMCQSSEFQCFDGRCKPSRDFCDNRNDCGDLSDENFCNIHTNVECPSNEVQGIPWKRCKDLTRCYQITARCNGINYCNDGSDEEDCVNKIPGVETARSHLVQRLLDIRQSWSLSKWNTHVLKAAVALFLHNPQYFNPENKTGDEMRYEISELLIAKLLLNKDLSADELSEFVNALMVSCMNPRDFYGVNLVNELRKQVDNSSYVNPSAILTLCVAGDTMKVADYSKVRNAFNAYHRKLWTDTQAVATIALACLTNHSNLRINSSYLTPMLTVLKNKQKSNGSVDDLKTTALVVQAFLAADSYNFGFNMNAAVKILVDSVNKTSTEEAYYILPVFGTKSLMDVTSDFCVPFIKPGFGIFRHLLLKDKQNIETHFSLFFGKDGDFMRTWKQKLPADYTFYDLLETVGALEPEYKAQYRMLDGKPYVSKLSKYTDDPVAGMFWFTYTRSPPLSFAQPKLITASPVDIPLEENVELILWYKPGSWNSTVKLYDSEETDAEGINAETPK